MAAPGENMRVNGDRLWDSLVEMAKIVEDVDDDAGLGHLEIRKAADR